MGPAGERDGHTNVSDAACGTPQGNCCRRAIDQKQPGACASSTAQRGWVSRQGLRSSSGKSPPDPGPASSQPETTYGRNCPRATQNYCQNPVTCSTCSLLRTCVGLWLVPAGIPGHGLPTEALSSRAFLHRAKGSRLPYGYLGLTTAS